jgi:hypothetical protein
MHKYDTVEPQSRRASHRIMLPTRQSCLGRLSHFEARESPVHCMSHNALLRCARTYHPKAVISMTGSSEHLLHKDRDTGSLNSLLECEEALVNSLRESRGKKESKIVRVAYWIGYTARRPKVSNSQVDNYSIRWVE